MNESIKKTVERLKNPKLLIIIGVVGITLIALSSFLPSKKEKTEIEQNTSSLTAEEYKNNLEQEIKEIVYKLTGNDSAVMVTLESGIKYDFADDTKDTVSTVSGQNSTTDSRSNTKSYITVKGSDGSEQALIITQRMPEIRGVAIICNGGDQEAIAEKIEGAVCAALNITSKRVYIAGGMSNEKR